MIKAAAHLHSTFSYDGKLTLPELRILLQRYGVQCALMTEHADDFTPEKFAAFGHACAENSTSDFLFIPGLEVPHNDAHILMLGMRAFSPDESLLTYKNASSFAVLAHPHRNRYVLDAEMREVVDAIEIWNSQYDGKHSMRPRAKYLCVKEQKKSFAGWDLHRASHAGGPVLEIDAPLQAQAVLEALRAGNYRIVPQTGSALRGVVDRGAIILGRKTNALLKLLGLKAPRGLAERVRKNI